MAELRISPDEAFTVRFRSTMRPPPPRCTAPTRPAPTPPPLANTSPSVQVAPALPAPPPKPPSTRSGQIIAEVCQQHGVTREEIISPKKPLRFVRARMEVMYRLREEMGWSFPRIGRLLNKDHSSCINGHRQHAKKIGHANAI